MTVDVRHLLQASYGDYSRANGYSFRLKNRRCLYIKNCLCDKPFFDRRLARGRESLASKPPPTHRTLSPMTPDPLTPPGTTAANP